MLNFENLYSKLCLLEPNKFKNTYLNKFKVLILNFHRLKRFKFLRVHLREKV